MKACITCGRRSKSSRCTDCQRENTRQRKARGLTGQRGSTSAGRRRRVKVLEKAGHRCFYCGDHATVADHFIPLSKGGADTEANLVAACRDCNQAKGGRMPQEFMAGGPIHHQRTPHTPLAASPREKIGEIFRF